MERIRGSHQYIIRMTKISTSKKIKLFDQKLFDVEDGHEPVLEL